MKPVYTNGKKMWYGRNRFNTSLSLAKSQDKNKIDMEYFRLNTKSSVLDFSEMIKLCKIGQVMISKQNRFDECM